MIAIRKVSKRFGSKWALREVNLDLAQGEFLSLFGPNGAGKTTLMRIVATLSKPTSGAVTLNGVPTTHAGGAVRHQLGLVSHQTLLYPDLTAQENLQFFGRMYDVPALPERVNEVLDLVGLFARRHDLVRTYSRGMQQRLAIARAIIHDPGIMLLDEPYTGLDPHAAEILRGVLQRLVFQDRTVIMTTHDLDRGLDLCDRVAILANGRIVFEARREEMDVEDFANIYRDHVAA